MKILVLLTLFLAENISANNKRDTEFVKQQDHSLNIISGIDFFTVGADATCQYNTIQSAINDYFQSPFGNIDIRIATNKTYHENLTIGNANITLTGGYLNCSDANTGTLSNNQSLIDGSSIGPVLTILGVTTRRTMIFSNLRLINGNNPNGAGGGLLSDNSKVALFLENVDIRNNSARNGAGIAIVGGDTDLLINESLILGNVADYGGGIYCQGTASSINVANHSGIIANFANSPLSLAPNGRGAGAYIDGCFFALYTGSSNNGSLSGMETNSSMNVGGAIYAQNAIINIHGHQACGSLGCLGDNTNPVSLRSNQSNGQFGAVLYAKNSAVEMKAVWIEGNVGASLIYLEQSQFNLGRDTSCWQNSECNLIENNIGIVIKGLLNDDINISHANIIGNDDAVFAISFPPTSTPVTLPKFRVESCMINNNGTNNSYLFDFFGPIDVKFVHNTIADNQVAQSIFHTDFNPNQTSSTSFEIHSSIISNPGQNIYSYDLSDYDNNSGDKMHITFSASLLNETNSITTPITLINDAIIQYAGSGGALLSTLDPLFNDRNNGLYHLSAASPAIDYVNTPARTQILASDIDFQGRGIDDPDVPNSQGNFALYDLGADERLIVDFMFANGFE